MFSLINSTFLNDISRFTGTAIGLATATCYSLMFIHVLEALHVPMIFWLLTFAASSWVFFQIFSNTWNGLMQEFGRLKWYRWIPFLFLSVFMGLALFPEFYFYTNATMGPLAYAAGAVSLLGTVGVCSLMLKNSTEFAGMPLSEILGIVLFYSSAVFSIGGGVLGFFPFAVPTRAYVAAGVISLLCLISKSSEQFGKWMAEKDDASRKGASVIYIWGRLGARVMDYLLTLGMLVLHITAEGCLPAVGVVRTQGNLISLYLPLMAKQTKAAVTMAAVSSAEFIQDFFQVTRPGQDAPSVNKDLKGEIFISFFLVASLIIGSFHSWYLGASVFAGARLIACIYNKEIYQNDKARFLDFFRGLGSLSPLKICCIGVSGMMGFVCAYEISSVFAIPSTLFYVFTVSGMFIESNVYLSALRKEESAVHSKSTPASSLKQSSGAPQAKGQAHSDEHSHQMDYISRVVSAIYGI